VTFELLVILVWEIDQSSAEDQERLLAEFLTTAWPTNLGQSQ
jgi:hypothetical protein